MGRSPAAHPGRIPAYVVQALEAANGAAGGVSSGHQCRLLSSQCADDYKRKQHCAQQKAEQQYDHFSTGTSHRVFLSPPQGAFPWRRVPRVPICETRTPCECPPIETVRSSAPREFLVRRHAPAVYELLTPPCKPWA